MALLRPGQIGCLNRGGFAGSSAALQAAPAGPLAARGGSLQISCKESRIGKAPVPVPAGVEVTLSADSFSIKGPKGTLGAPLPPEVRVEKQEDGSLRFHRTEETRRANQQHGLMRALANNMVLGTTEGWSKTLELVGVGYRGQVTGQTLRCSLGYCNPIDFPIPEGVFVQVEKLTTVKITGADKTAVGQFAATVRAKRPPEPYKQKGVRYQGEYIRKKAPRKGK